MTNKDRAVQELDGYKPRAYGGGVRTASLDQVAAQNTNTDMVTQEQMRRWRKQAAAAAPAPNYWIVGGIAAGVVAAGFLLIKYKVIKL